MISTRTLIAALVLSSFASLSFAGQATVPAAGIGSGALTWRHIGPSSYGGRIDDIEAVADNPSIMFVATASGGIFKTVNAGVTWAPVFDADGGSLSIGDVAIAPSDRNIVWAGTGEPNNRQSSSWGDGVYKSLDGGAHVASHGPEGEPPRRPHRHSSHQSRHRLRRRARSSVGRERRARAVQDR